MNNTSPLIKRIKRHITGPVHTFFIATSPGFKTLCKKELHALFPENKEIKTLEGGIQFTGKLYDCYLANLSLRTANRVLMRITDFNVTNFRRLEKKLKEIPWELYLKENSLPQITVTTHHSRLYHSDAISERVIKSIEEQKKATLFYSDDNKNTLLQNIFVRLIDDHITISLDSSGDLLYKRGIKQHAGKAPIRETMAAAALIKAGYTSKKPLLDPMCGTGTFSIEAAMINKHIPPGWYRKFAFQSWPGFKPAQWNHIKKQAEKNIKIINNKPSIISCDIDPKACSSLSSTIKKYNLENRIKVLNNSFFNITPADIRKHTGLNMPGLIIINPPYGIRLGTKDDSKRMFEKIEKRLVQYFSGWKFALFVPEKDLIEKSCLKGEQTIIDHGGLTLTLFTGKVGKCVKHDNT